MFGYLRKCSILDDKKKNFSSTLLLISQDRIKIRSPTKGTVQIIAYPRVCSDVVFRFITFVFTGFKLIDYFG